ncbi:MAG: aldose 1-epimerase family protein [Actinobacteria bacterium]|nr:aldose 1-epimerase family protein [Actinomycetota bacterium]
MAESSPTGAQFEISFGDQRAWVVEVGGGLRRYTSGGREVLDGYAEDELCRSGRGQCLLPWPNRVRDGQYEFAGARQQLALSEPGKQNAIHGLVRWVNWTCTTHQPDRVVMSYVLHPQPGYPHLLALSVVYHLDERGLTVEITAENVGAAACPFGAGAHPYLSSVSPTVDDTVLHAPGRVRLLADERGIPTGREQVAGTEFDFRVPRPIGALELDTAFADLERGADGLARVRFGGTTLWLDEHFTHLMLFSGDPLPDVARRALAVEPMTCAPNAFKTGEGLLTLAPEESFVARWGIEPA